MAILNGDQAGADLTCANGDLIFGTISNCGIFKIPSGAVVYLIPWDGSTPGLGEAEVQAKSIIIEGTLQGFACGFGGGGGAGGAEGGSSGYDCSAGARIGSGGFGNGEGGQRLQRRRAFRAHRWNRRNRRRGWWPLRRRGWLWRRGRHQHLRLWRSRQCWRQGRLRRHREQWGHFH